MQEEKKKVKRGNWAKARTRPAGSPVARLNTFIAPETKAALERQRSKHNVTLGRIIDALVASAEKGLQG